MRTSSSDHGPGIPFPPPLLLVVGFAFGLGIHQLLPVEILRGGRNVPADVLTWCLFGSGALVLFWAMVTFLKARTAIIPYRPASQLVAGGPFRYSRNPMYVGFTAMYLALSIWVDSIWPLVMLPLSLWVLWKAVIRKEETYLASAFGEEYDSYRRRVRRWL